MYPIKLDELGSQLDTYLNSRAKEPSSRKLLQIRKAWVEQVFESAIALPSIQIEPSDISWGLQLSQKLILIGGIPRSGTTLLRDLIDGNSEVTIMPAEDQYYEFLRHHISNKSEKESFGILCKNWIEKLVDPKGEAPYWILSNEKPILYNYIHFVQLSKAWWESIRGNGIKGEYIKNVTPFMLAYAQIQNGGKANHSIKYLASKTPGQEVFFEIIKSQIPKVKLIILRRKLEDSLLSAKVILNSQGQSLSFIYFKRMYRSLKAQQKLPIRHREYIKTIEYKELVSNRKQTLVNLFNYLEINLTPINLNQSINGIQAYSNGSDIGSQKLSLLQGLMGKLITRLSKSN